MPLIYDAGLLFLHDILDAFFTNSRVSSIIDGVPFDLLDSRDTLIILLQSHHSTQSSQ